MVGTRCNPGTRSLLLAGLCVLCGCQRVCAGQPDPGLREAVKSGIVLSAATQLGRKPMGLLIEDAYPVLVRGGLKRMYQRLKSFWLTLAYGDIEEVSDLVMEKLRRHIFGRRGVQQNIWRKLRNSFRDYLRDWWLTTPLVPMEALKTGVWHALLRLAADDLSAVLGGTPEYVELKQVLLDQDLRVISEWVEDIQLRMTTGDSDEGKAGMSPRRSRSLRRRVAPTGRKTPREPEQTTGGGDEGIASTLKEEIY